MTLLMLARTQYRLSNILYLLILLTAVSSIAVCVQASSPEFHENRFGHFDIGEVKNEMVPLNPSEEYSPPASTIDYFNYYGINFNDIRHFFGSFNAGDNVIAAHIYFPADPKGTIFLMHGYYDHAGILKNVIRFCLKQGFAVAVYDLPGHGLSTGERFSINDFSEYVDVLNFFVDLYGDHLPEPFHLISHSTGAAIAYEYLNTSHTIIFDKVIFLAPLVHHSQWKISRAGYYLAKLFVEKLPRRKRINSSDPSFIEFVKNDPLQSQMILPIKFLDALYAWDKRIRKYKTVLKPVMIIQGSNDVIVDWKYNVNFLGKKIETVHLRMIKNANHQLVNENPLVKSELFKFIEQYLED
ncbi:MAG: alpha/beta hydrolase [Proteobacteria bacterium]|nr:alpha/beta hydrolase [Pseudomonadota bacterium]